MMIDKPQQRGAHSLNGRLRVQRLQIPHRHSDMFPMPERGFVGFAGLKPTHDSLDLVCGTVVHGTLLI